MPLLSSSRVTIAGPDTPVVAVLRVLAQSLSWSLADQVPADLVAVQVAALQA